MDAVKLLSETYLVYACGERFRSKLVFGKESAFDALIEYIFGEMPDPIDNPDQFNEFELLRDDYENDNLWIEQGMLWETNHAEGYVVVVRVQSLLN